MSKRPSKTDRHASVTESDDDDAFLSRWARRKRMARSGGDPDAAQSESSAPQAALARSAPDAAETPSEADADEAQELTDEDMPPLETIDENTDMRGFFSSKVSQQVKKAALRKFFHSPAFNIVDGLDDYDDDFTSFPALGDIITSDMRGQMEREAKRAAESRADSGQVTESPAPDEPALAEPAAEPAGELHVEPEGADENSDQAQTTVAASDENVVTRDPARRAEARVGKLRPRDGGNDA
jgi:hypothetical protein